MDKWIHNKPLSLKPLIPSSPLYLSLVPNFFVSLLLSCIEKPPLDRRERVGALCHLMATRAAETNNAHYYPQIQVERAKKQYSSSLQEKPASPNYLRPTLSSSGCTTCHYPHKHPIPEPQHQHSDSSPPSTKKKRANKKPQTQRQRQRQRQNNSVSPKLKQSSSVSPKQTPKKRAAGGAAAAKNGGGHSHQLSEDTAGSKKKSPVKRQEASASATNEKVIPVDLNSTSTSNSTSSISSSGLEVKVKVKVEGKKGTEEEEGLQQEAVKLREVKTHRNSASSPITNNEVIEVETRKFGGKRKVKALVGAFETVISLNDDGQVLTPDHNSHSMTQQSSSQQILEENDEEDEDQEEEEVIRKEHLDHQSEQEQDEEMEITTQVEEAEGGESNPDPDPDGDQPQEEEEEEEEEEEVVKSQELALGSGDKEELLRVEEQKDDEFAQDLI